MALNWDDFLNTESMHIPHDQWSDLNNLSTVPPTSEMPKSTTTDTSGSTPEDIANFDSFLKGSSADPYFVDDSLFIPNDYFLGDLNTIPPLGNITGNGGSTSESSPEPPSATNLSATRDPESLLAELNQSPEMQSSLRQAVQRANTFPNPVYESMFPNSLDAGFVEDITFPDGLKGAPASSKPSIDRTKSANNTTVKRNKNKPDILSACWTSPLCPNHDTEGPPPNPSTCGGGCAPFLFANDDALPIITDLLTEPQEVTAADGIVEIQPRPKKRSDSETSATEPMGRQFQSVNSTESPVDGRQRMKSETTDDSPPKESSQAAEEPKPKSRRRLPHNQVERKYRESLNTQLESLRRVVPSLQQNQPGCDGADIEDLPAPSKPSKAVILASATAYIKSMEKDKKSLADENALLRARVKALQALVKCDDCSLMQYVMDLKINHAK